MKCKKTKIQCCGCLCKIEYKCKKEKKLCLWHRMEKAGYTFDSNTGEEENEYNRETF